MDDTKKIMIFSGGAVDRLDEALEYALDGISTYRGINSGQIDGDEDAELESLVQWIGKKRRSIARPRNAVRNAR